jgi:nucleobase:cation symporter-1, NCS1 family
MNFRSAQATTTQGESRASEHAGGTLALERHGIAHVPTSRRYGSPRNQFTVRFAPVIYLAGIFLGASGGPLGLGFTGSVTEMFLPTSWARSSPARVR